LASWEWDNDLEWVLVKDGEGHRAKVAIHSQEDGERGNVVLLREMLNNDGKTFGRQ
jgi:hypothetical protein